MAKPPLRADSARRNPDPARFIAALLAPLPDREEPVASPTFCRFLESQERANWREAMDLFHEADAWHTLVSLQDRRKVFPSETERTRSMGQCLDAYRLKLDVIRGLCRLPAPDAVQLRWKERQVKQHRLASPEIEAAIAADRARLGIGKPCPLLKSEICVRHLTVISDVRAKQTSMPRIFEMAEDFAERFAFEPSRVVGIVKALRDDADPLIKTGARGVNAPKATPLDAARILIAMMLRVKHHEAAEAVRLFGQFRPLADSEASIAGEEAATFEAALATLLKFCGQEPDPDQGLWQTDGFDFDIKIVRDVCIAQVTIRKFVSDDVLESLSDDAKIDEMVSEERCFEYLHPELHGLTKDGVPEFSPELRTAWRQYRTGFNEVPTLTKHQLIEIGQVLAGHAKPLGVTE